MEVRKRRRKNRDEGLQLSNEHDYIFVMLAIIRRDMCLLNKKKRLLQSRAVSTKKMRFWLCY